ncbi:2-dehydro-3-deoxygluconokinase [Fontibacillus phaseoli]|uniref:2-dehydro-3-deoxygluconokinase n=1 Tax=Fontibacillus phaseoli TaxID=1416533 RepID=A0A369BLV5_9BACL|nr:sugar kinase [Fontibacillus phaseoli]RCX22582.1 2-dehydro-3-deoxygluconokinase [Fontibacillus phaseoli]
MRTGMSPGEFGGPEVVTFGESMGLLISADMRGLEYDSKLEMSFGGAESNVAIGLARLGCRSGWFGRLGEDPLGRRIHKTIRGEGVDVSRVSLAGEAPTGLMLREKAFGRSSVYYYRRHSAASQMRPGDLDEDYIASAKILHVTGITAALSSSSKETLFKAVALAKKHRTKVSFDPNLRLKLWNLAEARPVLLALAEQADYFLPGLDELRLLYNKEHLEEMIPELNKLAAVKIIKGGDQVTYLLEDGELSSVPYYPVEHVVDSVGAGDGFCAGFLAGLLQGDSHPEAIRLGNLIGSMVIQAPGDWEGLPTREEVRSKLSGVIHIER